MAEEKAATEILMRLSEHYVELVSVLKGASRSFILIFLFKRAAWKFKIHLCIPESTDIILETLKNIHLMIQSL